MLRSVAVAALISVLLAWPTSAAAEDAPAPPSVSLTKTVYAGDDGGASCGSATSFAEAGPDDTVTYCFQVTNTGGTHLTDLSLGDAHVSNPITLDSADSTPLAPGHSAYYHVVGTPAPRRRRRPHRRDVHQCGHGHRHPVERRRCPPDR